MISSHPVLLDEYDVLLYLDSRGSAVENLGEWTWVDFVAQRLDQRKLRYLCVCRPKELTTIFSLLNFLGGNPIRSRLLVTNIGFVDLTPKKKEYVRDIVTQIGDDLRGEGPLKMRRLCRSLLNTGRMEDLFALDVGRMADRVGRKLSDFVQRTLLVGTIELPSHYVTSRRRPKAFFRQLKESNRFLRAVAGKRKSVRFVSCAGAISFARGRPSFDGVHLTQRGHDHVFRRVWKAFSSVMAGVR